MVEIVFADWPFGYGVRPWRTVGVSALLILIFALFYYFPGVIREAPVAPPKLRERKLSIRLTEPPLARKGEFPPSEAQPQPTRRIFVPLKRAWEQSGNPDRIRRAGRAIRFSFGVFTKLGMGGQVATRFKGVVIFEWVLGLVMLAGFAYTLSNTVPFLQLLFKAVF